MTEREALKLALETLEDLMYWDNGKPEFHEASKRIIAIKEVLAQPEQKPVATVTSETGADIKMSWWHEPALPVGAKLYTTPPQRKPLTDEEIQELFGVGKVDATFTQFVRAIEAAHGIKE